MRILIVSHRYPPFGIAGVERLSQQTAVSLAAAGEHVTVFTRRETPVPPLPKLERTVRDGVDVFAIYGAGPLYEQFPRFAPRLERMFERTLLEVEPDVVLIMHLINHSPMYVSIAHRWGVPVVMELHDFYVACERAHLQRRSGELCQGPDGGAACARYCFATDPHRLERWPLRTHMFRHALEHADAVICPSRFIADYFRETFGAELPPLHLIGNGVESVPVRLHRPLSRHGPLHIAYIGVVLDFKGPHVLLEALRMARLPNARLSLFGLLVQPYSAGLLEAAADLDDVEFRAYGEFEPPDLPVLLDDVDLVVVPSLAWESYSIVTREAFACGIPVVASRSGALPEAVRDGENGLLFEPGSAAQLAVILQDLDGDRERLNSLAAGIRNSDWISVRERTEGLQAVLHEVVSSDGVRTGPVPALEELSILREALLVESVSR